MSVPIATSPGRSGFGPQSSLSYDSGRGNGPFGFGWSLSLPTISRRTDKGLPRYDASDVFVLSDAEDLVPVLVPGPDGNWAPDDPVSPDYRIERYRPRVEGLFARIERWTRRTDGDTHWRTVTRDNVAHRYGQDTNSRVFDPADAAQPPQPQSSPSDPPQPGPSSPRPWSSAQPSGAAVSSPHVAGSSCSGSR